MFRRSLTSCACFVVAVLIGSIAGRSMGPRLVGAATVSNFQLFKSGNSAFWNYDFNAPRSGPHGIDWPVSIVFTGHASMKNVEAALTQIGLGNTNASPMYQVLFNGKKGKTIASTGHKTDPCKGLHVGNQPYDYHVRLYGSAHSREWGEWTLGTTHFDFGDCNGYTASKSYGWTEQSEKYISYLFKKNGYTVRPDTIPLANAQKHCVEGPHFFDNDGRATQIVIPARLPSRIRYFGPPASPPKLP